MIKLSDYLNYLNNEVVLARKKADEQAVEIAKLYSDHEYLKYFKVPRFSMPSVKLNIPIKINELDARTKFNFKMDENSYISEVNEMIDQINKSKDINIKKITKDDLHKKEFVDSVKHLEKRDQKFVKDLDKSLNEVDFSKKVNAVLSKLNFSSSNNEKIKAIEKMELSKILKSSFANRFTPIAANLNEIFIDPNTANEIDKDKILVNMEIEMIEEGLRINKFEKDGKIIEEIIVD